MCVYAQVFPIHYAHRHSQSAHMNILAPYDHFPLVYLLYGCYKCIYSHLVSPPISHPIRVVVDPRFSPYEINLHRCPEKDRLLLLNSSHTCNTISHKQIVNRKRCERWKRQRVYVSESEQLRTLLHVCSHIISRCEKETVTMENAENVSVQMYIHESETEKEATTTKIEMNTFENRWTRAHIENCVYNYKVVFPFPMAASNRKHFTQILNISAFDSIVIFHRIFYWISMWVSIPNSLCANMFGISTIFTHPFQSTTRYFALDVGPVYVCMNKYRFV